MMTFNEFLSAWQAGTLEQDAAWRAYDIRGSYRSSHVASALKALNLKYAGELAMSEFCARYNVKPQDASAILGSWWLWHLLSRGRPVRRIPLRSSLSPGPERASSTHPSPGAVAL